MKLEKDIELNTQRAGLGDLLVLENGGIRLICEVDSKVVGVDLEDGCAGYSAGTVEGLLSMYSSDIVRIIKCNNMKIVEEV